MSDEIVREALEFVRARMAARGYRLTASGLPALREWVAGLLAAGAGADAVRERCGRLADVLMERVFPDMGIGRAEVRAAAGELRDGGRPAPQAPRDGGVGWAGLEGNTGSFAQEDPGAGGYGGARRPRMGQDPFPDGAPPLGHAEHAFPSGGGPRMRGAPGGGEVIQPPPPSYVDSGADVPSPDDAPRMSAPGTPEPAPAPRSAYALVDAPEAVVAEEEFEVTVGLSPAQSPGVIGDVLAIPDAVGYPYVLAVRLVEAGFDLADGAGWRRELTATAEAPYPRTAFRLRALPQAEAVTARAIQVSYSTGGQTIGVAVRPVAVLRGAADRAAAPPREPVRAVDIRVVTETTPADLTIQIAEDAQVKGRLSWTMESPHPGIGPMPDQDRPIACDIGDAPEEFAKQLVQQVNQQEGKASLRLHMMGVGRMIADMIPQPVWDAIHAAARAVGGPPSILILSAEPYVPWELAVVPAPLLVPDAPPFLGAQANVGRWLLKEGTTTLPRVELGIASMAVVWGIYDSPKWARLKAAEDEAAALREEHGAVSVDARVDPVAECLGGTPPAQALHFAVHGVYNPGGTGDGLVLTDNHTISEFQIRGGNLVGQPLVFLNACQVGSGTEILGNYAGMASAFLSVQASAVVAPLWSVKDTIAKEIALAFYRDSFAGEPVAAVLRRQRARYGQERSATFLAYQYFGHPELRISRLPPTP